MGLPLLACAAAQKKTPGWRARRCESETITRRLFGGEQLVDLAHDGKGVGHVKHVGLALRPATGGVEVDGASLVDEAPADGVRLFAVAAGGQPLGVARRGAGLADLVEVAHELEHLLALAAQIDERFGAAEGGLRLPEETEDDLLGLGGVRLAVGLLLGPAGAGDEEQFRVRADRLLVGGRSLDAGDGGALMRGGQGNGYEFDAGLAGGTGKRGVC